MAAEIGLGALNLRLDSLLRILNPDYTTSDVEMLTETLEIENGDRFQVHLPDYRYSSCIVL